VRRRQGTGLVRNERKILTAALRLALNGELELYGYELFARLLEWEGESPMDHGTLYRCLRSLEGRGFLSSTVDQSSGRVRVNYRLTDSGFAAAREAAVQLAAEDRPPAWVDLPSILAPTRLVRPQP
jgi:DNA-binding PadR family transcriptional regulator